MGRCIGEGVHVNVLTHMPRMTNTFTVVLVIEHSLANLVFVHVQGDLYIVLNIAPGRKLNNCEHNADPLERINKTVLSAKTHNLISIQLEHLPHSIVSTSHAKEYFQNVVLEKDNLCNNSSSDNRSACTAHDAKRS